MSTANEIWELPDGQLAAPELVEAAELLNAYIRPDRISAIVRRPASSLGGRCLLGFVADGDPHSARTTDIPLELPHSDLAEDSGKFIPVSTLDSFYSLA